MDEQQQENPTTQEPNQQPGVINALPDFQPAPPPQGIVVGPKRHYKKPIIITLILLLLAGGAAAVYFLAVNKVMPTPYAQSATTTSKDDPKATELTNRLKFQMGTKLYSYDVDSKKTDIVTSSLPKDAHVLDFYQNSATWRAYYETPVDKGNKTTYWFIEKDKQPVELSTTTFSAAQANAKQRLLAYTILLSAEQNATADEKTTRTFIVKDGKTEEVWRSNAETSTAGATSRDNPKDPLFALSGVSGDGTRLLFHRYNCVYCDGGVSPTSFELNLSDKKPTAVFSSKLYGGASYGSDGASILVDESDDSALGGPTGPVDLKVTRFAKAGATAQPVFAVSNKSWSYAGMALDDSAVYTLKLVDAANYVQAFEGFYSVTGTGLNQIKKLGDPSLPNSMLPGSMGPKVSNCYGLTLHDQGKTPEKSTAQVGALCVSPDGATTYTKVDETIWNASAGENVTPVILR